MVSRFYKHKLLLDEGFPPRVYFPRLNQRFDIKHVKNDLRKIGLPDRQVYALAADKKRLIVTYNTKDFRKLAGISKDTGVIGVSALMPYSHIDNKLISLLTKRSSNALYGKFTNLTERDRNIKVSRELENRQLSVFLLLLPMKMQSQNCLIHNPRK